MPLKVSPFLTVYVRVGLRLLLTRHLRRRSRRYCGARVARSNRSLTFHRYRHCHASVVERRRPIDPVIAVGVGRTRGLLLGRFTSSRLRRRRLAGLHNQPLPDADHVSLQAVPRLELRDAHAFALRDGAQRVARLNDDASRIGFRSGRSQRAKAQHCDPESSEHPDPVYRNHTSGPRNLRKTQDVALPATPGSLNRWAGRRRAQLWCGSPHFCG